MPETTTTETAAPTSEEVEKKLQLARDRFKQARDYTKEDFDECEDVQAFIAGEQWPTKIKAEREAMDRPCLVLDHLNQYVRSVVNSGIMKKVDPRVLSMDGEGDEEVAQVLAGIIRQVTQTSTARVAYETGLRHSTQVGFGYWRVKAEAIPGAFNPLTQEPLLELGIRKIPEPRMVLFDPFAEYPDGRDGHYCFVLTKLTKSEYEDQYGEPPGSSWANFEGTEKILPWLGTENDCVVAEYYYREKDGKIFWCIITPDAILDEGKQIGDLLPIVRCVGDEYEYEGKQRRRGMVQPAMDSQRTYNYASSALVEGVALAPLAPFIAADGQIEQYAEEWKDANRVPRSVLRYKPMALGGQPVPPPQRTQPAGLADGWQQVLSNLLSDQQQIMGMAQPAVSGGGAGALQSALGVEKVQAPAEINTYHFHEHWLLAIEQTGRIILAMIPYVYTVPQVVKIIGDEGELRTAVLDPSQQGPVLEQESDDETKDSLGAVMKVTSKSYNPMVGRYDVVMTVGPSSPTKKAEANKMIMTMVNAAPQLLGVAGDLLFKTMDIPMAEQIAKRLQQSGSMPNPEQVKMMQAKMQQQEQQIGEMEKLLLAEQQKAEATMAKAEMDNRTKLAEAQLNAEVTLEISVRGNINDLLLQRMKSGTQIETEVIRALSKADAEATRASRMEGYGKVQEQLTSSP